MVVDNGGGDDLEDLLQQVRAELPAHPAVGVDRLHQLILRRCCQRRHDEDERPGQTSGYFVKPSHSGRRVDASVASISEEIKKILRK